MLSSLYDFAVKKYKLILPLILTIVLSSALFSVYLIPVISGWTLAIIAVVLLMFAFCEFINKHNFIGGTMLVILVMLVFSVFFSLIRGNDYGDTFRQWFLTGADQVDTKFEYLLALLISFVPFFSVVVYYFTNILYRMSFLTLASLIPCAVYVKVLSEIDNVYICLIAILNVAILMISVRSEQNRGVRIIGRNASVLSACVFMFVILVFSAVIPKENDARYYDRFEELFMNSSDSRSMGENFSLFSEFSGNADSYRNFSNRRLYTVYGEAVPYFKRQSFDYYDFENDRWYSASDYSSLYYTDAEWEADNGLLSLAMLQQAAAEAEKYSPGFSSEYGLDRLIGYEQLDDSEQELYVQSENFGAVYFLSPARAVNIEPMTPAEQIYVTRSGVFRFRESIHDNNLVYRIRCFNEYSSRFFWFELGGADFSDEDSIEMLTEMSQILAENGSELYRIPEAYINVHYAAQEYDSRLRDNTALISDEVRTLALEITSGYTYDWEKANALQNYFITNGYVYDLDYISDDTSPEHFLFESKRGSCSDFASAYVLLARSAGLCVRYAEGYVPDITSREGVFAVKDSGSHAYPEVYIQNMGWIVFEPTVPSDYREIDADISDGVNLEIDYNLVFVMCVIAGIILIIALAAIILYPAVSERIFFGKVKKSAPNDAVIMVYNRISGRIMTKILKNPRSLTPYELSERLSDITGTDISSLAFALEKVAYGGGCADENDKNTAVSCYNAADEAVKAYKKQKARNERKKT